VVEQGEQCDDGNMVDTDACNNMCRINVTAFKFTDLDLRDPHVFATGLCLDVTPHGAFGFSVNDELRDAITLDGDGDGLLDLAPTLVFRSFNQTATTQPVELHFANCTAPQNMNTTCTASAAQVVNATATFMNAGQCLALMAGTVRPYNPPVGPTPGPCFVTNPVTVTLNLGGIPITLQDARLAGQYSGNPATGLTNGLLLGFISEAVAEATTIPASFPVVGGDPLSSLLATGTGNTCTPDDRDMNGAVRGWWFYLNFTAGRFRWI
jgi:cysteine-rich repeat protein